MNRQRDLLIGTMAVVFAVVLLAGTHLPGAEPVISIQNDALRVSYETASGKVTIVNLPTGQRFITDGQLTEAQGTAQATTARDKIFGDGQALEVRYPSGAADRIMLFPKLSFALFRATFPNAGAEAKVLNKIRTVSVSLDLGKPAAELTSMGTGGLLPLDKNPGSYAWQAVAEPISRNGVVGGWLTHDRGSGVIFTKVDGDLARLDAQVEYGRLRIAPGKSAEGELFALGYFADARLGLEAWADAVAQVYHVKLPPQPAGYCTWYSDKHAGACDEVHLAELAAYAAKQLKPFGFDFIQIDDNWQDGVSKNGPKRSFTTHATRGPYPSGMKATAEKDRKSVV